VCYLTRTTRVLTTPRHRRPVGSFSSCPVLVAHQLSAFGFGVPSESGRPLGAVCAVTIGLRRPQGLFLCSTWKPVSSSRPALARGSRVETASRLAVGHEARRGMALPGHALTASSTAPAWGRSGRQSSCQHLPYVIFRAARTTAWRERMRAPPRTPYSRSSFVASLRRFGLDRQCRTISS
jgi:hypothetical protein